MAFTREKFGLFFSLPPDSLDFGNLSLSHCTRVQLPLAFIDPETCKRLGQGGCSLTVRVPGEALGEPQKVAERILQAQEHIVVEAAILGNEPDMAPTEYQFGYGSPDWGVSQTFMLRERLYNALRVLDDVCPLVSPPLSMRSISEDDPPAPGRTSWYDVLRGTFNLFAYNGCHIYGHSWRSDVDRQRIKWAMKFAQESMHRTLYIDELGFAAGPEAERVGGSLAVATMLLAHPLGQRVEFLSPFISNGTGVGWSPRFLIRDPASYRLIGEFMGGRSF